jgi:hypothetical protein
MSNRIKKTQHFLAWTLRSSSISMLLFLVMGLSAQSANSIELIGSWSEGPRVCGEYQDNYFFVNNGGSIEIYEVTDSTMVQLSKTNTRGYINDLLINDTLLYLAIEGKGLSIYNVADMLKPEELSFLPTGGYYINMIRHQDLLYFSTNSSVGLHLIDITDPHEPFKIKSFPQSSIRQMSLNDHYLYAAKGWYGYSVFDITDPEQLEEIYSNEDRYTYDIEVINHIACLVQSDTTSIADFSNPANPVTLGKLAMVNVSRCMFDMENERLFVGGYELYLVDISQHDNPQIISVAGVPDLTSDLTIRNKTSVTVMSEGGDGARVFTIDSTGNLVLADHLPSIGYTMGITTYQDYVYLANNFNGIGLVNISDPQSPVYLRSIQTGNRVTHLEVRDQLLYCSSDGLIIYDLSDPGNPVELSYTPLPNSTERFKIKGDRVYLAARTNGLVIIDISDPENPTILGQLDTPGSAMDLDVHDDRVYLADWRSGLRMIDISDVSQPTEIAFIDTTWVTPIRSVMVFDQFAWIGSTNFGIRIVDISDPSNPFIVNNLNTSRGLEFQADERYVYVSAGFNGFYIFDRKDPANPEQLGYFDSPGDVYAASLNGDNIFLADYNAGFSILHFDKCAPLSLKSTAHNISCYGLCDGLLAIDEMVHAQQPVQYAWSNGQSTATINDLCPGTYSVTATDAQNCSLSESFTLFEPDELQFSIINTLDISDENEYGAIEVFVSGGTPDYQFHWQGPNGFESENQHIHLLAEGCYQVEVTDANGCILSSGDICIADNTTGTRDARENGPFIVFPNPATDQLWLRSDSGQSLSCPACDVFIEILAPTGEKLLGKRMTSSYMDVSGIPSGIYLLSITVNNRSHYQKLVIE